MSIISNNLRHFYHHVLPHQRPKVASKCVEIKSKHFHLSENYLYCKEHMENSLCLDISRCFWKILSMAFLLGMAARRGSSTTFSLIYNICSNVISITSKPWPFLYLSSKLLAFTTLSYLSPLQPIGII